MKLQALLLVGILAVVSPAIAQDSKENADFKLAINLYNDGLYDLAAEQLRQFVNAYPATSQGIDARFYLGMTQLKLKRYEDARMTFQSFALTYQDNPRAPEAWLHTGEAYAALNNPKEAALAFERVKVFHPKSKAAPDALLQAAHYFAAAGQRDDARRVLKVILQEYPASGAVLSARTQLGKMYFEDGNIEQAQNELRRVIDGDPSAEARAQALLVLGNINQATRKTAQAQENYQEIITKYKTSTAVQGALVNLARLLASSGHYTDAADNFRKALGMKAGPDSALTRDAMLGLAEAETAQQSYTGAVTAYEKFIAAFPNDERMPEALWNMALSASKAKKYAASNEACQRLLKSNMPEVYKRRAQIRLARNAEEQQNANGALQAYQAFADQYQEDLAAPEVVAAIGRLYEQRLHDPRKACAAYELLATRYPRSPFADDALMGAARCHEQMKETDRALDQYRELINRYPASDFRADADRRVTMIETFEAKDKDAGLEKLALLVGDVVADKDRLGLSYRLGEIYFQQMKNYEAAVVQFSNAINSGMTDNRFVDALYMRAKSYDYLTLKDEKYRQRAVESYQTFLQTYPNDPRAKDAMRSLFFLRATTPGAARAALAEEAGSGRRDTMLLYLGGLLEHTDSTAEAADIYREAAYAFPGTPSAAEALYRTAMILGKTGQVDSAYALGEAYLAQAPEGPHAAELISRLAVVAEQRGDHAQAVSFYRRLANEFGYTKAGEEAREGLAHALIAAGEFGEGEALYKEIVQQAQTSASSEAGPPVTVLLGLARAQLSAGHSSDARSTLMEVLRNAPSSEHAGQAYTMLGWIAKNEGSTDLATSYFRQAEQVSPGVAASRDVADLLYANGNYADAIKQYNELSKAAPTDSARQYFDAQVILAKFRNNDLAGAEHDMTAFKDRYGRADDYTASFEIERGGYYFRKEDYAVALKVFTEAAKKFDETPSAPSAQYWIGRTLEASGKKQEAIATLEDLVRDHPQADILPKAHFALGNLYYDAEKWPESIRNYRVIVDDPNADPALLPYAMSNLIETYEIAGVNDAALALTRKYLERYPNSEDSFDKKIKIGILYDNLGYYDQAVMQLQGLLDQAGSDLEGEIRYYIAEANYNKGDYQQAILDFLKVPYLVTKKGKIDWTANSLYMSGQSYEKMGRYDQALTMYQQIVERAGIDETFKAAARKEIERVKLVVKKNGN